jgi:hypothetical protein
MLHLSDDLSTYIWVVGIRPPYGVRLPNGKRVPNVAAME